MIRYYVRVRTKEQLDAALLWGRASVLLPDGELAGDSACVLSAVQSASDLLQIVLCLPDFLRQSRLALTEETIRAFCQGTPQRTGLLVRSLDELGMIRGLRLQEHFQGRLIADPFLYASNSEALRFYLDLFPELWFIGSDELTDRELQQALQNSPLSEEKMIIKVYGHQPLMISNQCLNRNHTNCTEHLTSFRDSRHERFFAAGNCRQCYSTIYNGKCTWLLDKVDEKGYAGYENLLLDFTVEDRARMEAVFSSIDEAERQPGSRSGAGTSAAGTAFGDFTRAHHYKGVE